MKKEDLWMIIGWVLHPVDSILWLGSLWII
jgi:hypothetical protein